ncbi:MAG: hypothetical protein R6U68_10865, partial [Desulfobacteraceae bacterium]
LDLEGNFNNFKSTSAEGILYETAYYSIIKFFEFRRPQRYSPVSCFVVPVKAWTFIRNTRQSISIGGVSFFIVAGSMIMGRPCRFIQKGKTLSE